MKSVLRQVRALWKLPRVERWRTSASKWQKAPYSGMVAMLGGIVLATLLDLLLDHYVIELPNPGLIYLPFVAFLAYHWNWRYAVIAAILQLACVYLLFIPPRNTVKFLTPQGTAQLVTLAAVTGFVLAVVQLARQRRAMAEREAGRLAALNRVGTALTSELNETRLLRQIAETARNLTGAEFAAFTLRPTNEMGQPTVPSEGNLFHLAAVVGVSQEQEALFRRMPLGGEGLLAPIFRFGVPVRVPDALSLISRPEPGEATGRQAAVTQAKEAARQRAFDYAHGHLPSEELRSMGVPRGHPNIRSFLGAPLLDRNGQVRGGLLLGHSEPDAFTAEDEALLVGLAAQAAVALENARLYHAAQTQAQELDAIFESIKDGVVLVDGQGRVLRENRTARDLLELLVNNPEGAETLLRAPAARALQGEVEQDIAVTVVDDSKETREYIISASSLRQSATESGSLQLNTDVTNNTEHAISGSVVVWHDVTEAQRLLREQRAHAETEAQRALLQTIIDELPSGVYLVRGCDAQLVLANHAAAEVWGAVWPQGQPMREFLQTNGIRVFHFDGRPLAPEEFATLRAVQKGESVHHHQEIIRHPDGTALPVLVNAVALDPHILGWSTGNENGSEELEPVAIVVHQDVTALKEAERLKDEFIGIAAHELRTPLAVLKGFAQMLITQTARGKGVQLADWQMEAVQDIDQATARLVELTEDLLDVTRLQAGRLELQMEPTDLVALTRRVVGRFKVTFESHPISISAMSEHVIVEVNPRRIEQVLNNLINNAIKYSPEGGEVEITVREDKTANMALLSVRDQGIGIPAHQQSHIFGRFVRGDNARAREIGGTGLGLYLSSELVQRHNGRIWFESIEGEGSTFCVSLPLATSDEDEQEITSQSA